MTTEFAASQRQQLEAVLGARHVLEELPDAAPAIVFDAIEVALAITPGGVSPAVQLVARSMLRIHQLEAPANGTIDGALEEIGLAVIIEHRCGTARDRLYFVQGGEGGPIKIGHSTSLASRLVSMQSGSPVRLQLLLDLPGGEPLERFLHEAFSETRLNGEWFSPSPALISLIEDARRMKDAPDQLTRRGW